MTVDDTQPIPAHRERGGWFWLADDGTTGRPWIGCCCGWTHTGPEVRITNEQERSAAWADLDTKWLAHLSTGVQQ